MSQNCAMVDATTGRVVNVIVADPETDNPWPGHILVAIDEGKIINTQWGWDEHDGFFPVDPDLAAQLRQHAEDEAKAEALKPYLLDD